MVPKLRFKEFCGEWEEKKLGNYVHLKNGLNIDKNKFGQGIPLISVMDILNNDFIVFNNIKGKVDIDSETLKNYSVTYGDILFQRSSETREDAGKSNVYLDKEKVSTFGGFVIRGKKIGIYNPAFMNSLLKTSNVRKEITSKAQGAQHINISQESLEKANITLPSLPEQTKIADFLSTVDNKIQNQQDKITHLENIKKGFMQKIFSRKIRFKDDGGEAFPEWEEKKITDIANTYIGLVTTMTSHYKDVGVPLIRNSDVKENKFIFKDPIFLDDEFAKLNKARMHKIDDIITVHTGDVGTSAIIDKNLEGSLGFATIVTRIIDKNKYSPVYICHYHNSCVYKNYIMNMITGDGRNNLNMKDFNKSIIPLPCLKEQQKIADFLSSFDEKISTEKETLEHLKQLKKGLLQQMFI